MLKCSVRGKTIAYSSYVKKKNINQEDEVENNLQELQKKYEKNPTTELNDEILLAEQQLKILREKKVSGIMFRAKARWQAEGEKSTNYFCNLEKRHYNEKLISKIIDENGIEIVDQFEI